jgi:hypothetical protein
MSYKRNWIDGVSEQPLNVEKILLAGCAHYLRAASRDGPIMRLFSLCAWVRPVRTAGSEIRPYFLKSNSFHVKHFHSQFLR